MQQDEIFNVCKTYIGKPVLSETMAALRETLRRITGQEFDIRQEGDDAILMSPLNPASVKLIERCVRGTKIEPDLSNENTIDPALIRVEKNYCMTSPVVLDERYLIYCGRILRCIEADLHTNRFVFNCYERNSFYPSHRFVMEKLNRYPLKPFTIEESIEYHTIITLPPALKAISPSFTLSLPLGSK